MKNLLTTVFAVLSVIAFGQTPNYASYNWQRGQAFQDTTRFNDTIFTDNDGNSPQWSESYQISANNPNFWAVRVNSNNPITKVSDLPFATSQNYAPSLIKFNDTIRAFTKSEGVKGCYYYYSTDEAETWTLNSTDSIIPLNNSGDRSWIAEFRAFYDNENADSLYMFFKGGDKADLSFLSLYYATSPINDFPNFSVDEVSIGDASDIATLVGTTTDSIIDLAISDVLRVGDTIFYFGYYDQVLNTGLEQFGIWLGYSLNAGDQITFDKVLLRSNPSEVIAVPTVFASRTDGQYVMILDKRTSGGELNEKSNITSAYGTSVRSWEVNQSYIINRGDNDWISDRAYAPYILKDLQTNRDLYTTPNNEYVLSISGTDAQSNDESGIFFLTRGNNNIRTLDFITQLDLDQDTGLVRTTSVQGIYGRKFFTQGFNIGPDASNLSTLEVQRNTPGEIARFEQGAGFALIIESDFDVRFKKSSIGNNYASSTVPTNGLIVQGNTGIGTDDPTSQLEVGGDIEIGSLDWMYFGDPNTDGSWRMGRDGNNFVHQRRESSVWVTKQTITP